MNISDILNVDNTDADISDIYQIPQSLEQSLLEKRDKNSVFRDVYGIFKTVNNRPSNTSELSAAYNRIKPLKDGKTRGSAIVVPPQISLCNTAYRQLGGRMPHAGMENGCTETKPHMICRNNVVTYDLNKEIISKKGEKWMARNIAEFFLSDNLNIAKKDFFTTPTLSNKKRKNSNYSTSTKRSTSDKIKDLHFYPIPRENCSLEETLKRILDLQSI